MSDEKNVEIKIGGRHYEGRILRETVFFVWTGPLRDVDAPYNGSLPSGSWPKSLITGRWS